MIPLVSVIVALGTLYWGMRVWRHNQPRLKVTVSQKSRFDSTFNRSIHFVHVSAVNVGGGATTVNRLSIVGYRSLFHRLFNVGRVSVPIQATRGMDVVKLPRKLTTGEEYETDILETVSNLEPLAGLHTWMAVGHTMSESEILIRFRFATDYQSKG